MELSYRPAFRKFVKKQGRALQLAIEDETERAAGDPRIGESKKGDLSGFRVHKFVFHGQGYLMAYRLKEEAIVFYMIGTHENFYRDLRRYAKEVER